MPRKPTGDHPDQAIFDFVQCIPWKPTGTVRIQTRSSSSPPFKAQTYPVYLPSLKPAIGISFFAAVIQIFLWFGSYSENDHMGFFAIIVIVAGICLFVSATIMSVKAYSRFHLVSRPRINVPKIFWARAMQTGVIIFVSLVGVACLLLPLYFYDEEIGQIANEGFKIVNYEFNKLKWKWGTSITPKS